MLATDKKEFARAMVSCFQNYRANISKEMIVEWFESKLYGFTFYAVSKAFVEYVDNYKNKFPPTRGEIIHLALCASSKQKYVERKEKGCINLINGNVCGKEIEIIRHCLECYENIRDKSDVELMLEKIIEEDANKLREEGCVTREQIIERIKQDLQKSILGRQVLNGTGNELQKNSTHAHPPMAESTKNLMRVLDERQRERYSQEFVSDDEFFGKR